MHVYMGLNTNTRQDITGNSISTLSWFSLSIVEDKRGRKCMLQPVLDIRRNLYKLVMVTAKAKRQTRCFVALLFLCWSEIALGTSLTALTVHAMAYLQFHSRASLPTSNTSAPCCGAISCHTSQTSKTRVYLSEWTQHVWTRIKAGKIWPDIVYNKLIIKVGAPKEQKSKGILMAQITRRTLNYPRNKPIKETHRWLPHRTTS
jgi:hypothetical protein